MSWNSAHIQEIILRTRSLTNITKASQIPGGPWGQRWWEGNIYLLQSRFMEGKFSGNLFPWSGNWTALESESESKGFWIKASVSCRKPQGPSVVNIDRSSEWILLNCVDGILLSLYSPPCAGGKERDWRINVTCVHVCIHVCACLISLEEGPW